MKKYAFSAALAALVLTSCTTVRQEQDFDDLANREMKSVEPGKEYRIGVSGVCGKIDGGHILVTYVIPNSPAFGKVKKGDIVRAFQYRGVGGSAESIRATTEKRIFRLGRDWDWHLYLTIERQSLRDGKGNTLTFDLRMPRPTDNQYHFGPTGFFATIHPDFLEVDHVTEGSPSDGKLQVGDQIVAVDGKPITGDVFKLFTERVDHAESEQGGGKLVLMVRRATAPDDSGSEIRDSGKKPGEAPPALGSTPNSQHPTANAQVENSSLDVGRSDPISLTPVSVTLQLKVLGSYSQTAPINCPKTDAIITETADGIVARGSAPRGSYGRIGTSLLALLSTGEKKYIDHVGKVIHAADWAKPDIELPITGGSVSWHRAYKTMTLCEYYLLTGDKYVLPAIKTYANVIARGQDAAGLWNHQSASPDANFGKLHGRLFGYGAINQTSVALWISLILSEECGVKDPEVRAAVEKTHNLYSYWIERGKLPYGNHGAGEDFFTNNGTSGSVAVGFALLKDWKGASFFARLSAAATKEILTGHTGPWFNQFWSGVGANLLGPEVARSYNKEIHWLRTVTRTWDDRFLHMEARGCHPGGHGLGSSGSFLLNLSAGRRKLRITGRDMGKALWLDAKSGQQVVDAANIDYSSKDVDGLMKLLGHQLPPVRTRASEMLAIKDAKVADQVMKLLAEGNRNQRIGAVHAISSLKLNSALDKLMEIVGDTKDDLWIRELALKTMTELDGAKKHAPELLKMLAEDKTYDVQGRFDEELGGVLVKLTDSDPYAAGLDRDLLYQAVGKLLDSKRQNARGAGMSLIKNITLDDLPIVVDKMIYVIKDTDRTYVSYHGDGHRQAGLNILYGLNIDESLDLTLDTINERVGRGWRKRNRVAFMKTWGGEAKRVIPKIKEVLGEKEAPAYIEIIEEADTERKMISLDEALKGGEGK